MGFFCNNNLVFATNYLLLHTRGQNGHIDLVNPKKKHEQLTRST
jgi:hypothetical protein